MLINAQTYMPSWIKFSPCPADDINTKKDNWHKNEEGYQKEINEAWKIICYVREKSIPDFGI